jgi:hypothetical protein
MFRLLHGVMAALFFFGAAVQFNDPDPLVWMAIYVAAAIACVLAATRRLRWWFPAIVAAIAFVWAATFVPTVLPSVRITQLFAAWEMADTRIEEGREMYGLLIIFGYMTLLAVTHRGRQRA